MLSEGRGREFESRRVRQFFTSWPDNAAGSSPSPRRSIAAGAPEWGSDDDLDKAMLGECRKLAAGPCQLAGSDWCEHECPFREGNW